MHTTATSSAPIDRARSRRRRGALAATLLLAAGGLVSVANVTKVAAAGEVVVTPPATTIDISQTNHGLSDDFDVSGFGADVPLLVNLSLSGPSGTTFSLPTTTGLVRGFGYSSWVGVSAVAFVGVQADVNAALDAMTVSTNTSTGAALLSLSVTRNEADTFYSSERNAFYQYVASGPISYTAAKAAAAATNLKGRPGYLVTVTSQAEQDFVSSKIQGAENIWIGGADSGTEGLWKWDAGPEAGATFWTADCVAAGPGLAGSCGGVGGNLDYWPTGVDNGFTNWCAGEPNNSDGDNGGEDFPVTNWWGDTCWNDLASANASDIGGYVIEYGDAQAFTGVVEGVDGDHGGRSRRPSRRLERDVVEAERHVWRRRSDPDQRELLAVGRCDGVADVDPRDRHLRPDSDLCLRHGLGDADLRLHRAGRRRLR